MVKHSLINAIISCLLALGEKNYLNIQGSASFLHLRVSVALVSTNFKTLKVEHFVLQMNLLAVGAEMISFLLANAPSAKLLILLCSPGFKLAILLPQLVEC